MLTIKTETKNFNGLWERATEEETLCGAPTDAANMKVQDNSSAYMTNTKTNASSGYAETKDAVGTREHTTDIKTNGLAAYANDMKTNASSAYTEAKDVIGTRERTADIKTNGLAAYANDMKANASSAYTAANAVDALWARAAEVLASSMSQVSFDVWIKTLFPLCAVNKKLILITPSISSQVLINKNYIGTIRSAVLRFSGLFPDAASKTAFPEIDGVEIITDAQKDEFIVKPDSDDAALIAVAEKKDGDSSIFVPKYTFDNFVQASSNDFVFAAAVAVANKPGGQYNPLFIHGGVGLGKTHLMHAIGNRIRGFYPSMRVVCVPTEKFTNELIDSIRNNRDSREFREKYRTADVLMLDDVQFLSGKSGTQDAVFHTFNDLYQKGKQIILTSDKPPKEIALLEERLSSRFACGLTGNIQPPDHETRVAILKKKALQEKYNVDPVVINFIADKIDSNVREMEGLLSRVVFYATLVGKPADSLAMANEALKDYIDNKSDSVNAGDIIDACCNFFRVAKADITGKKKNREIVEPRQIAIYLITEMLSLPLVSIGQLFGGRDHTTVMHARDKIAEKIKSDPKTKATVVNIKTYISEVKKTIG